MAKPPANIHWLQNNNTPQRQQNQLRPGPAGRPNGQTPQRRMSPINRWLLIIVALMLGIYLYQYFSSSSNSSTSQRTELTYSAFYDQITAGNIKSATINGQNDVVGDFCNAIGGNTQYHVIQLPNGDPNLAQTLLKEKPTCVQSATVITQAASDNSFWLNL